MTGKVPQERLSRKTGEEGYNLVVLLVLVTVMNVALALALPSWTHHAKREKEQELIFRGLQYAEAVRVFQARHGRFPNTLEELVEVEPRSIRQLFEDPMSENGKWGLLVQSQNPRGGRGRGNTQGRNNRGNPNQNQGAGGQDAGAGQNGGQQQQQQQQQQGQQPEGSSGGVGINPALTDPNAGRMNVVKVPPGQGTEEGFGRRDRVTAGPIVGVYSAVDEESIIIFNGSSNYQDWEFRTDLIPTPALLGGDSPVPRVNSSRIGRPWPEGLQPQGVGNNVAGGQDLTGNGLQNRGNRNRGPRNERRGGRRN